MAPELQLKITPPQSKPDGQSALTEQSLPQKLPVCPSVTKVRHDEAVPHSNSDIHALQSVRPGRAAQVPVVRLQNWSTGQNVLSRQKKVHCPFTHEFLGLQSPSSRHPARQLSVAVLQMSSSGQCSSRVHGPLGMQRVVVVSQKVPPGQSRFEVHEANDWQ